MRCRRASNGESITFHSSSLVGHGGEAFIYAVQQDPSLLAKVYHEPTARRARKLAAMLANPPEDPMRAQGHASIAWPLDLLWPRYGQQVVGFLMPRVVGVHPIIDFYNPRTRREVCPLFNYLYLHRAARNFAAAVAALHERGIVIGDVNESNILVSERALVTLVDTDSFQVPDPQSGQPHRCPVGRSEFTPPELQGRNFATVDRLAEHDRFGLAVLIFQLLMEGLHPYAGRYRGGGDPPPYEARIAVGHFPHGTRPTPYQPPPTALPFDTLAPVLRALFLQCFEQGHADPKARPEPEAWLDALERAEGDLRPCRANAQHWFGSHLARCPWCQRAALLGGRDPFPSVSAAEQPPPALRPALRFARPSPAPRVLRPYAAPLPAAPRVASHRALAVLAALVLGGLALVALWRAKWRNPDAAPVRAPDVTEAPRHQAPNVAEARRLQAEGARTAGVPVKTAIDLGSAVTLDLVLVPAGSFRMGSESGSSAEKPVHEVKIPRPFYIGKFEVTQEQWEVVMGSNPSRFKDPNNPVESVSWGACQEFLKKLNEKTGRKFSLPTEAEWEYACRAVTTTEFCFGDDEARLDDHGWCTSNSGEKTHPVGQKKPNAWGLYDMHGNVWEWCEDVWHADYEGAPSDGSAWLQGGDQSVRVVRGGSWGLDPRYCRSAFRHVGTPSSGWGDFGLRVVLRDLQPASTSTHLAESESPRPTTSVPSVPAPSVVAPGKPAGPQGTLGSKTKTIDLGGGVKMDLVLVPAGSFRMGSEEQWPAHRVRITKPFYIGRHRVTREQWEVVMGSDPSRVKDPKKPVDSVTWNACQNFLKKLKEKTGRDFCLPSEAEWEYACSPLPWEDTWRRGAATDSPFADDDVGLLAPSWERYGSGGKRQPGDPTPPDAWGPYAPYGYGSIGEWCEDVWHPNYEGAPSDGSAWVHAWVQGGDESVRVVRCVPWEHSASLGRFTCESRRAPRFVGDGAGLRVVFRDLQSTDVSKAVAPPVPTPGRPVGAEGKLGAETVAIDLGGGMKVDLVLVPAGSFRMGSEKGNAAEKPVHKVKIPKPFYVAKYEVTQEQWEALMGSNPSRFKGARNPVEGVSWEACQEFLKKLNEKTRRKFVLPTEAEWEYACRAGAASEFCFGDDDGALGDHGWHSSNSRGTTRPVGQKKPNAWGLYDMHGNVWEWCEDVWHDSYQGAPTDGSAWSRGGDASGRVVRGGSWSNTAGVCRAATRYRRDPSSVSQPDGFRVCLREF